MIRDLIVGVNSESPKGVYFTFFCTRVLVSNLSVSFLMVLIHKFLSFCCTLEGVCSRSL